MSLISKFTLQLGLFAAALFASWMHGSITTRNWCEDEHKQAQIEAIEDAEKAINKLPDLRQETRERVRTIYVEKDDSGCADAAIPERVLQQLQRKD